MIKLLQNLWAFISVELDVECGGYLNSIQGDISLRDVDQDGRYDNYVSCNWSVMAAKGHVILFKIFSMDIEPSANCQYDYLKVSRAYFKYIIQKSKCLCIII